MPTFKTDDFILRVTVNRQEVTEKVAENTVNRTETELKNDPNRTETEQNRTERFTGRLMEKSNRVIETLVEKAIEGGERLSDTRVAILKLMVEDPYISKVDIGKALGLHPSSVWRNIEAMRGKYVRRVGPDKGGFWEIIG